MKALVALSLIAVAGCTTTSRMDIADLDHFRIDCSRKEEQLAFLNRQFPGQSDRYVNAFRVTSVVGTAASMYDGTYNEERALYENKHAAVARLLIFQIHSNCPTAPKRPQGCVHLNEDLPSGTAQGAVCYQDRQSTAVVKRWGVVD